MLICAKVRQHIRVLGRYMTTVSNKQYTAAAIIIGNEVLSGKTHDTNSHVLARELFTHGIRLCRVETIPDIDRDIIDTVLTLSSRFDYVFTSGGIGCTHDDITYRAISDAFDLKLELHQDTIDAMSRYYEKQGKTMNGARLRMATLPSPADRIITTAGLWVPVVQCRNVFILPGIPVLFEQMLHSVLAVINHGDRQIRISVVVNIGESEIADHLAEVQRRFPNVEIGSYPKTSGTEAFLHRTQLCFTSTDHDEARAAASAFEQALRAN